MITRNEFMSSVTDSQLDTVEKAIRDAFPSKAETILATMRFDAFMSCFMFEFCGMQVGCELDGYIHS